MKKFISKSNIIALIVISVLFGYIGWLNYNVQKEKEIYVIGMCAKDSSPVWNFSYIKNADDIKIELKKSDGVFYKYFKRCEIEYIKAPKSMRIKYLSD